MAIDDPANPYDGASPNDPGIAWVDQNGPKLLSAAWSLFVWPSPVGLIFWGFNQPDFGPGFAAGLLESVLALAFWIFAAFWFSGFWAFRRETMRAFLVKRGVKQVSPAVAPPMALLGDTGQTQANSPTQDRFAQVLEALKFVTQIVGMIPELGRLIWKWRNAIFVAAVVLAGWLIWRWIDSLPSPFRPSRDSLERTIDSLESGLATERVRASVAIPAIEEPQTFRRNTDRIREEYAAGNERLEAARHAERLDYLRAWRDADRELRDAAVTQAG